MLAHIYIIYLLCTDCASKLLFVLVVVVDLNARVRVYVCVCMRKIEFSGSSSGFALNEVNRKVIGGEQQSRAHGAFSCSQLGAK